MNVSQIFETMEYGKAPEASDEAMKWIASFKGRFGHFVNGTFTKTEGLFPSVNPATMQELAKISQASKKTVSSAVKAAPERSRSSFGVLPSASRIARMVRWRTASPPETAARMKVPEQAFLD